MRKLKETVKRLQEELKRKDELLEEKEKQLEEAKVGAQISLPVAVVRKVHFDDGQNENKIAQARNTLSGEEEEEENQEVKDLKQTLAQRDEEIRILKDDYKKRVREKESEFQARWKADAEVEDLKEKLAQCEEKLATKADEVKQLKEYIKTVEAQLKSSKDKDLVTATKRWENVDAKGKQVIAMYDFKGSSVNKEISFSEGTVFTVIDKVNDGWWEGELSSGERGIFPFNYVKEYVPDAQPKKNSTTAERAAYAKSKIEARYLGRKSMRISNDSLKTTASEAQEVATKEKSNARFSSYSDGFSDSGTYECRYNAIALYDFEAQNEEELAVRAGEALLVVQYSQAAEWCLAQLLDDPTSRQAHIPVSYIQFQ